MFASGGLSRRFVAVWRVWSFLCRLSAVLGLGRSLGLVGLLAPVSFGFVAVRRGLAFPFLLAWSAAARGRCRPFEEEEGYPLLGGLRSGVGGRGGALCGGRSFWLCPPLGVVPFFLGSGVVPVALLPLGPQGAPPRPPPPPLRSRGVLVGAVPAFFGCLGWRVLGVGCVLWAFGRRRDGLCRCLVWARSASCYFAVSPWEEWPRAFAACRRQGGENQTFGKFICTVGLIVVSLHRQKQRIMENNKNEIPPVLVTILKVVAYAIGLILAGVGTTTTASAMGIVPTPWV